MRRPGQTDGRCYVLDLSNKYCLSCVDRVRLMGGIVFDLSNHLSIRLFVCYQTGEHDILKTSEPIFVQISKRRPWGRGMKRST